jgi:hypothetical protein
MLALGSVLVVGGGAAAFIAAAGHAGDAPSPPRSAPDPPSVTLHLSVTPRDARMTLDGKAISGNPAVLSVRRDELPHELQATRRGYKPVSRTVRFERDLFLDFALHKVTPSMAGDAAPEPSAAPSPPRQTDSAQ